MEASIGWTPGYDEGIADEVWTKISEITPDGGDVDLVTYGRYAACM